MLLETLVLATKLLSVQPSLPSEHYILRNQDRNPAAYAQASEESSINILLKKAEEQALKNPKHAAEIYINILNSSNPLKEKAVESALNTYEKLLEKSDSKELLDSASMVFNYLVDKYEKKHENIKNIDRFYLLSGLIMCCKIDDKNVKEGVRRLSLANDMSDDLNVKYNALYTLGFVESGYAELGYKGFTLKKAREYSEKAEKIRIEIDRNKKTK